MGKQTPLFAIHQRLGARIVDFGGWDMPVQYSSIVEEHLAVRQAAGLFDIAHMGEITARGPAALDFLNQTLTNDLRKLGIGQGHYTLMCREDGGTVDDLYAYRLEDQAYLLIVNAARIEADWRWLTGRLAQFDRLDQVELENASKRMGALALQGPAARGFIDACVSGRRVGGLDVEHPSRLTKNQVAAFEYDGARLWVSCTGYTGEDGFELVGEAGLLPGLWERVMKAGQKHGLKPAGLGARDTLRTEMCYPLYGHELDERTSPIEAGLGFFVALDKPSFVGREVLHKQKTEGVSRRCVAFKLTERGAPPRPHYPIWSTGEEARAIGEVTSGTQSPSLGVGIGLGYVPVAFARAGTPVAIEIRGRRVAAEVVKKPIYRKG